MSLWKVTSGGVQAVAPTAFKDENLLEQKLEEWIETNPQILGEPLLVIGRQVRIPDVKDRIDLLAIDPEGNVVIVEIKRTDLKDPVDVQALRYASYISKWRFEDLENAARSHLNAVGDPDFNFNESFETFCQENGADDIPDLNEDQRIIIVGTGVREKLGSVILWLRNHNIDIKLIEVQIYKDDDGMLIEPTVIVPTSVNRFSDVGRIRPQGAPWITDGKVWHLEKRSSPKTASMLLQIDKQVRENSEVDGPRWNQKAYVAYRVTGSNWLLIHTRPNLLILDIFVKAKTFDVEQVARELGIAKFDKDESLAEKLGLPSSVIIRHRNDSEDRVRLRIKEDFKVDSKAFTDFLDKAFRAHPK